MHMKYLVDMTCTFLLAAILLKILKWALPSLSLNLEAQYHTQSWIQSGATYSQEIIENGLRRKKIINVLKNFTKTYTLCHVWRLCTLLLAGLLIAQTSYFADISHYAPD